MSAGANYFEDLNAKLDKNDLSISAEAFADSIFQALPVLSDLNPKLRDDLAWSTLSRYLRSPLFPSSMRSRVLDTLLSAEYVFFDLEGKCTESAVKRSFSALTVADVVTGDIEDAHLDADKLSYASKQIRHYLSLETDLRGFVEPIGWVHCLAHTGDAVLALNRHPNTRSTDLVENARAIQEVITRRGFDVFKWGEDQRLGRPLARTIARIESNVALSEVLQVYTRKHLFEDPSRQNVLNTLRCTYLDLHWNGYEATDVLRRLREIID